MRIGKRTEQTIARAVSRRSVSSIDASDQTPSRLAVRGLGCFDVSIKQADPVKWISKKSKELFAYLLVNRGRSVTKEWILENVFPDIPFKNAETYLHTAIYQLRKALSLYGVKEMVLSAQEQYRLDVAQARGRTLVKLWV